MRGDQYVAAQNGAVRLAERDLERYLRTIDHLPPERMGIALLEFWPALVARYGEFVLYRPRVGPATWLLWFGPLLVLGAGGVVIWRVVASRRAGHLPPHDDSQEW